ncbi:Putative nuclease [Frankliniella fusca]|uniref:Nuclease n=1 Tax=Frankliniella fusca TaxID=407009 RepID=A0AAE1LL04_9NEOP|nr:Putative nuclease [Frankliniella fusca]
MTVWILSNKDTMRGTAITFGVSPGVLFSHYAYLIEAIRESAAKYIQWPTPAEREETKRFFQLQSGYPGIVGAIDGTHIEITSPKEEKPAYVNRNAYSSITVQAVVDHKKLVCIF